MVVVAILTVLSEQAEGYRAYEAKAESIMARHGGAIERVIEVESATPGTFREVHIVGFPDAESFERYRRDPDLAAAAPERAAAIVATELLIGRSRES